jgi:hypothetical protein
MKINSQYILLQHQRLSTSCGSWNRLAVKQPIEIRVKCLPY